MGWLKQIGPLKKFTLRRMAKVDRWFMLSGTAFDLLRTPKVLDLCRSSRPNKIHAVAPVNRVVYRSSDSTGGIGREMVTISIFQPCAGTCHG